MKMLIDRPFFRWTFFAYLISTFISISLMDFLITFLVIALLYALIKKQTSLKELGLNKILSLGFLWLIVSILGLWLRSYHHPDWPVDYKYLGDFKWLVTFSALVYFFKKYRPSYAWFNTLNYLTLFIVFICALQVFVGIDLGKFGAIPEHKSFDLYRAAGFFGHPISFSHAFLFVVCLYFGVLLFTFNKSKASLTMAAVFALAFLTLMLSFTRGVWIGLAFAFFIMFVLRSTKGALFFLAIGAAGLTITVSLSSEFRDRLLSIADPQYHSNFERVELWQANLAMFKEHPLLGVGYKNNVDILPTYFDQVGAKARFISHAHNQYAQVLSSTGLLGFLCFVGILALILYKAWELKRAAPREDLFLKGLAVGLLGAFICFYIGALTQNNFDDAKVRHSFFVFAALTLALNNSYLSNKQ